MNRSLRVLSFLILSSIVTVLTYSGCSKTTVVLLKDPEGKVGHLVVENEAGSVDITKENEATTIAGATSKPAAPKRYSEDKISSQFGEALNMLPTQPKHFILYFKSGSTELTDSSKAQIPDILKTIELRSSEDISVVGHTDTAGNSAYNMRLSQRRASVVRKLLIGEGVRADHIQSTSHGEANPLVKTADNVNEPKNRRVEVVVR
ncbi:MAG: OmpA family protein [Desulfobulbaceae bacterium]|nr:MAG: OmpA family protein [Desulfobulbaceae bacterium]